MLVDTFDFASAHSFESGLGHRYSTRINVYLLSARSVAASVPRSIGVNVSPTVGLSQRRAFFSCKERSTTSDAQASSLGFPSVAFLAISGEGATEWQMGHINCSFPGYNHPPEQRLNNGYNHPPKERHFRRAQKPRALYKHNAEHRRHFTGDAVPARLGDKCMKGPFCENRTP